MKNDESRKFTEVGDDLVYDKENLLGKGRIGNRVYYGKLKKPVTNDWDIVAVKRIQFDSQKEFENIKKEIHANQKILHKNFAQYFDVKQGKDFVFIALELCRGSLEHVVKNEDVCKEPFLPKKNYRVNSFNFRKHLLYGIAEGLEYLHKNKFIHRDLKPSNVLIKDYSASDPWRMIAAICDLELTRKVKDDTSELSVTHIHAGTIGWMAPEVLNGNKKVSNKIDIFSYGCIVQFVLSLDRSENYIHPFGKEFDRKSNISKGKRVSYLHKDSHFNEIVNKSLSVIKYNEKNALSYCDFILADMLIGCCIDRSKKKRLYIIDIIGHPLFWSSSKRMKYLETSFNLFKDPKNKDHFQKKGGCVNILEINWLKITDGIDFRFLIPEAWKYTQYYRATLNKPPLTADNSKSVYNFLMRQIRNLLQHWMEAKAALPYYTDLIISGTDNLNIDEHLGCYFFERIPFLFPAVYIGFLSHCKEITSLYDEKVATKNGWDLLTSFMKLYKRHYDIILNKARDDTESSTLVANFEKLGISLL